MPITTYTPDEVAVIIRVAYVTGVKDALVSARGGERLDSEQAQRLTRFLTDWQALAAVERDVIAAALATPKRTLERLAARQLDANDATKP